VELSGQSKLRRGADDPAAILACSVAEVATRKEWFFPLVAIM
jgi:hypothetical protein